MKLYHPLERKKSGLKASGGVTFEAIRENSGLKARGGVALAAVSPSAAAAAVVKVALVLSFKQLQ